MHDYEHEINKISIATDGILIEYENDPPVRILPESSIYNNVIQITKESFTERSIKLAELTTQRYVGDRRGIDISLSCQLGIILRKYPLLLVTTTSVLPVNSLDIPEEI